MSFGSIKNMDQFFIFQVRVNLIQQNLVTLVSSDVSNVQRIATDILQLYRDVVESKNPLLNDEYFPQIERLCTILESKTTQSTVGNDEK